MGRKKGEIRGLALTLRCVKSNMNCNNNKAGKNRFQEKKVEIVSHKKNIIETTSRIDQRIILVFTPTTYGFPYVFISISIG